MQVNPATITGWIEILQRKGYVTYTFGMMRSIRIIKDYQCPNDVETVRENSESAEETSVRTTVAVNTVTTTKR